MRYQRPKHRQGGCFSRILIFLLLVGMIAYPFYEALHINVDKHTASITSLPSSLKGIKLVYLSDIHYGSRFPDSRVSKLVAQVNALEPDLILLGGDYADDTEGAIEFFEKLPMLRARLGVFGVLGNHDRTNEALLGQLTGVMYSQNVTPLNNQVSSIKIGSSYLYIAGVDDYYNGFPDVKGVAAQLKSEDTVIFLGHTPDLLPQMLAAKGSDGNSHWFDLALFGHTHGGQVTILGTPVFSDYIPEVGIRYLTGWREENRASLLVSNGVGTGYFPVRLFAPAQIHLITLKKK